MSSSFLHLIIFDIDGTLLLSGPRVRALFSEAFQESFGRPAPLDGLSFAGHTDRWIVRTLWQRARAEDEAAAPAPSAGEETEFLEGFARFVRRYGELMARHYPTAEGPYLMPGVRRLLDALHRHPAVRMLVATGNLEATARIKLRRFGLDAYLPHGVFGDTHLERVDVLRQALRMAEERWGPTDDAVVWAVGDTVADVRAAREVGVRSLAVLTGPAGIEDPRRAEPDAVLDDFSRLEEALAVLTGEPAPRTDPVNGRSGP